MTGEKMLVLCYLFGEAHLRGAQGHRNNRAYFDAFCRIIDRDPEEAWREVSRLHGLVYHGP